MVGRGRGPPGRRGLMIWFPLLPSSLSFSAPGKGTFAKCLTFFCSSPGSCPPSPHLGHGGGGLFVLVWFLCLTGPRGSSGEGYSWVICPFWPWCSWSDGPWPVQPAQVPRTLPLPPSRPPRMVRYYSAFGYATQGRARPLCLPRYKIQDGLFQKPTWG